MVLVGRVKRALGHRVVVQVWSAANAHHAVVLRRLLGVIASVAVHRRRTLNPLFCLFVARLALVLRILFGMRRSATTCNAHEVSGVWT